MSQRTLDDKLKKLWSNLNTRKDIATTNGWKDFNEFKAWALSQGYDENSRILKIKYGEKHSLSNSKIIETYQTKRAETLFNVWRRLRYPNRTVWDTYEEFRTWNESLPQDEQFVPRARLEYTTTEAENNKELLGPTNCMWVHSGNRTQFFRMKQERDWEW